MSRKNKHPKSSAKPPSPHTLDSAALATQAETELAGLRYREAVELYKELLKRERRPEWVDGLAAGYAGRARALAAKEMFKEALVLWRNRHQMCGKPLLDGPYLDWLVQAGEEGEVLGLLADRDMADTARAELEARFAGLVLTAADGALPVLPEDSPLLRHRLPAREALAACCRGDLAVMDESLKAIPFRSPYRDLKPILKALALVQAGGGGEEGGVPASPLPNPLPRGGEGANERFARQRMLDEAIDRLPVGGPFGRLAAVLRLAVLPEEDWLEALRTDGGLDEGGRRLLLEIMGCPDALRPLLLDLARLGAHPPAEALFDLLLRHRRVMPEGVAAGLCRRLLPHAIDRMKPYSASFGSLSAEEREHLLALGAEVRGRMQDAGSHWSRMADLLSQKPTGKLRAALILRHLVRLRRGGLKGIALELLERSLAFDPEDRQSHLLLIGARRANGDLSEARVHLERAMAHFPKDAGVLLEAVEVALAGKAFKKAAGLAKQVLELDPINPQVRTSIGHAHLAHARKQIKAGKLDLARKELDAAAEWLRAPMDNASLELLRALAVDEAAFDVDRMRTALDALGGKLVGAFHLMLETGRTGFNSLVLLAHSGIDLKQPMEAEAVVAFAHALNAAQDGERALRTALGPLRKPLTQAAKAQYSEADLRLICEALHRRQEYDLLRAYADAALRRWPGKPLFVYFRVFAQSTGQPYLISSRSLDMLDQALRDAQQQGDHRTAQRIGNLMRPPMLDDPFFEEEDEDAFDMPPLGDGSSAVETMLNMGGEKALLEMARMAMGKRAFNELRREFGGDDKTFARFLVEMMMKEAGPHDFSLPIPPLPGIGPKPRDAQRPPSDSQKDLFDD